ncbi:uncharacterized protein NFIA_095310 [Aspergillus fischeri NRRL 181]|uniref:BTB domain-containing protein n=1 Tax=Neosartorya fischeri (strain ATCC 1020 / DSM 3700 / CBS 544.65 / FGSC A1164 / JCM 1740 / NRRL 181 / WB 181) TaxID=331117 RepID=A1DAM1_NEOFI|nr:conserved hypothetical protein [Aspergillus fischeri NRRL 181]EAW19911.1 conserved hypothetical protein [Aspergillus fischeri NRRL 181]
MTKDYYELNPDGDVILIFTTADPDTANQASGSNAALHESTKAAQGTCDSVERSSTSRARTRAQKSKRQVTSEKTDTPKDGKVVRIKVSSKHLSLASPVFEKMFHGLWKETQGLRGGPIDMEMDWQNMDAMLILMNAIHGNGPDVPREVGIEMLKEISILVDYYDCHKAIHLALDLWIRPLLAQMAKEFCDEILSWIWISWVFRLNDPFRSATRCVVAQSKGPISSLGLPIYHRIVDAIEKRRDHCMKGTLEALRRLLTDLRDGRNSCSFECDSFRLGALSKQLHAHDFLGHIVECTIPSVSLDELYHFLVNIKSPAWCDIASNFDSQRHHQHQHSEHPCTLQSMIKPILNNMTYHMRGCELEDFKEVP